MLLIKKSDCRAKQKIDKLTDWKIIESKHELFLKKKLYLEVFFLLFFVLDLILCYEILPEIAYFHHLL